MNDALRHLKLSGEASVPRGMLAQSNLRSLRFVSYLDMQRFFAEKFTSIASSMAKLSDYLDRTEWNQEVLSLMSTFLEIMASDLEGVQLYSVGGQARRLSKELEIKATAPDADPLVQIFGSPGDHEAKARIRSRFETIEETLSDDLKRRIFFRIAEEDRQEFDPEYWALAEKVRGKFPSVGREVREAGKCLALDRLDASVFHSMRALEPALWAMADALGVPSRESWGRLLVDIDKKIAAKREADAAWRKSDDGRFFSKAAQHFHHYKNALRNDGMHLRTDVEFDREEARLVLMSVTATLTHLSSQLSQPSPTLPEQPSERSPDDGPG